MIQMPSFKPLSLMNRNKGVLGLNLAHLWDERQQLRSAMQFVLQELAAGRIRPVVARTFPLEHAADAHRYIQSRANIGKVVLTCGGESREAGTGHSDVLDIDSRNSGDVG